MTDARGKQVGANLGRIVPETPPPGLVCRSWGPLREWSLAPLLTGSEPRDLCDLVERATCHEALDRFEKRPSAQARDRSWIWPLVLLLSFL